MPTRLDSFERERRGQARAPSACRRDPAQSIGRAPDGRWLAPPTPRVRDLTFEELRRYDIGRLRPGSVYASRFPEQDAADGVRMPSLREALSLDTRVLLLIEMKTSPAEPELTVSPEEIAEAVVDTVRAGADFSRIMILSFDWRALRHVRRHDPDVATGWLTQPMNDAERRIWWGTDIVERFGSSATRAVAEQGGQCWLPEFRELREPDVAAAQRLGLAVIPWNVDSSEEITSAIDRGVDGLITDRPDRALAIREVRKRSAMLGIAQ